MRIQVDKQIESTRFPKVYVWYVYYGIAHCQAIFYDLFEALEYTAKLQALEALMDSDYLSAEYTLIDDNTEDD